MNIAKRAKAPTPKFFKILRTIGLALLGISGSVMAAPVALPSAVVTAAGYIAVAGGVMSAVSQVTVDDSAKKEAEEENTTQEDKPDG
ncbi:hypothetical protein [Flavobacterium sp.]|uniref:hypothetical protein n=1 Tax=Flavobacterium sp. TaxID=239 RepID=UPI0026088342|nr:hypothetical protein [Flavobacterium sp.]MDD2985543.1 hypothetical protein [Flavobacterium sp.]